MPSESARATTAAEARFRIQHPNSKPRAVKVIALDEGSRAILDEVAKLDWIRAAFFTSLAFDAAAPPRAGESGSVEAWLKDIAGQTKSLIAEIDSADLVVMVSSAGGDAQAALLIGEACAMRKVTTIGLVVEVPGTAEEDTSRTLRHMRPFASMLVIASGAEYIEGMLAALRA